MQQTYITSLKTARRDACLTQEQAAEAAGVSLESWKAYEYGKTLPPCGVAYRICQALGAEWLALEYLREASRGLGVLPEVRAQSLPTAVITLINKIYSFADNHRDRRLMQIAEDSVIDDQERPEYDAIVAELDGIIGAALAVKFPKGQKEGRSVAGTTKRQVFRDLHHRNDSKIIIPHRGQIASPNFARGGGVSP